MLEDDHVSYVLAALANYSGVLSCPLTISGFLCLDPSQLLYSFLEYGVISSVSSAEASLVFAPSTL